uniref:Major facilitator superfamily (MFS) profile domain-containing protein n=1 Tax=Glossina austeni TaxID=7395 RepID=A0A1A9VAX7_GLOAU
MEEQKKVSRPDPIIIHLGDMGRYQLLYCLLIFLAKFPSGWVTMSHMLLSAKGEYYCEDGKDVDPCTEKCKSATFNRTVFTETINMSFDLTCGRFWLSSLSQFLVMGGIMTGAMIFGVLSDKYGRRIIFIIECVVQLVFGVIAAFSLNYPMYALFRYLHATATGGQMTTSFVLIMEIIGPKYRETMNILYQIPFNLGHATLPLFSYFLRDWHYFYLSFSSFSIVYLIYICVIFESPRWLFATGRLEKSIPIVEKIARRNGRRQENIEQIRPQMEEAYQQLISSDTKKKSSILDLFRTPNLRRNTLIMLYEWFNVCVVYYGSAQFISTLSGDIFLNIFISGILGVPGTIACVFMTRYLGRRPTMIISNGISTCGFLVIACITILNPTTVVVFAIIGLFGASITFPNAYLYAGEIFPTLVRTTGLGLCSCIGRSGSMIAPFVTSDLALYSPIIPPTVYAACAGVGFVLTFFLPETKGRIVPETIEDGEALHFRKTN